MCGSGMSLAYILSQQFEFASRKKVYSWKNMDPFYSYNMQKGFVVSYTGYGNHQARNDPGTLRRI